MFFYVLLTLCSWEDFILHVYLGGTTLQKRIIVSCKDMLTGANILPSIFDVENLKLAGRVTADLGQKPQVNRVMWLLV